MPRIALIAALLALGTPLPVTANRGSILEYIGECVPFARAASGIQIFGDAWTWWDKASGKYRRGYVPQVGAVIVFPRSPRLPLGHVAVVSRVVEKRVLMITHANWSRVDGARGHAEQDVTLYDISHDNDWSQVRVWYRDSEGLGSSIYPVVGFIYGDPGNQPGMRARPSPELSSHDPDYVAALIDAYAH